MPSSVPHGTAWGSALFLLDANDLPVLLSSLVLLYADDVKTWRAIKSNGDCLDLQNDLVKIAEWSKICHLTASKRNIMHSCPLDTGTYKVNNNELPAVKTSSDLRVIVSQDFKTATRFHLVATIGFGTL